MVKGPSGNVDAEERLRGFRTAIRDAGKDTHAALEFQGDFTESSGYRCAKRILRCQPRPSAVFAANDYMAVGLMSALREAGLRVPEDVAVAGFDDIAIAQYLNPPLTTVRVDAYELGEQAVRRWVHHAAGGTASPEHQLLPTKLVIRNSCGSRELREMDLTPRHRPRTPETTSDDTQPDPVAGMAKGSSRIPPGRAVEGPGMEIV